MTPLHRHQLARLRDAGWRTLLAGDWDPVARACLAHWAAARLPLVVTRQADPKDEDRISLGLPAPGRWGRRRLALSVARSEVAYFDEFPLLHHAGRRLPAPARPAWRTLCQGLQAVGANARVYGSYGWELLSGLDHVRPGSDIDLWLSVTDMEQADAAAACLQGFAYRGLRLDGELMFVDGGAVAWREWVNWRSGRVKSLLVKATDGNSLLQSPARWSATTFAQAA
ncbi:malonate decarboxylase holo-[acyl-carrier-protein] synthase [Roseateles sp. LYH14W]|uniref:Malonate decarboxylase holo-[acyl-carrier-protein] synthase n=1 Tax=Pelomonas parva TaxID=3299032 RepID=A0ABW7F7R1_9BURK